MLEMSGTFDFARSIFVRYIPLAFSFLRYEVCAAHYLIGSLFLAMVYCGRVRFSRLLFGGVEFLLYFTYDVGELSPCFVSPFGVFLCGNFRLSRRARYSSIDFMTYCSCWYLFPNVYVFYWVAL